MPNKNAVERAEKDKRAGKSASTQAGEFVREEMKHIREGKHGARSTKQAIAIGLSEARRAGVKLGPPKKGRSSEEVRHKAERDLEKGEEGPRRGSSKRSRATSAALKREGGAAASPAALARQGRAAAAQRSPAERSAAARKAAQTKGAAGRSAAARKAAQTRAARRAAG
ncbi:MAG: DUF6496 domain-containing protein [Rhodocyclaceae bacterium]|nr:DUF6496 domain-containing protein [Rhodocyclaceae bacterium]